MKDSDVVLKLKSLVNKYEDEGLSIDIEFTNIGIIFRGYWANSSITNCGHPLRYNRRFSYEMFNALSDAFDMECLIVQFRDDFESEIKKGEIA